MRVIETRVYTIDEHPNKELCYEWIRENMHDLNAQAVREVIDSLEVLAKRMGTTVRYSISAVPDRGEFIVFEDVDQDVLSTLNAHECPLTGVCWDISVIEAVINDCLDALLDELHEDTEYVYSDEALYELADANCWEFDEQGKMI